MLARSTARSAPLAALAVVLAALLVGCKAQPGLWDVELPCAAVKQQARTLRITIAAGRCDARGAVLYDQMFAIAAPGPVPPDLAPGAYAFSAEARAEDGAAIGRGCTEAVLPDRRDVHIAVGDLTGQCARSELDAGAAAIDAAIQEGITRDDAGRTARHP